MYVQTTAQEAEMKAQSIARPVIVFVALSLAGVGMAAGASEWAGAALREVLIPIGSAMFAAGLAFFLVEMFARERGAA
jgi:hypothetical protein